MPSARNTTTGAAIDALAQSTIVYAGFRQPTSVALDGAGNAYVLDSADGELWRVSPNGTAAPYVTLPASVLPRPPLKEPGIAASPSGTVYLGGQPSADLLFFDVTASGKVRAVPFDCASGTKYWCLALGSVTGPNGIASDRRGNVYLSFSTISFSDPNSGGVFAVTPSGEEVGAWRGCQAYVGALAVAPAGTIYAVVQPLSESGRTADGPYVCNQKTGKSVGKGWVSPQALAADGDGNVYVADPPNVYRVTASGSQAKYGSGFVNPLGLAAFGGSLYVADSANQAVDRIAPDGTIAGIGHGAPSGIACDAKGDVYLAGYGDRAVYRVGTSLVVTTAASGLVHPRAVALSASGNLYVADVGSAAVYEIAADGSKKAIGARFSIPVGVAVDASGNVFVADNGKRAVYRVAPSGTMTAIATGLNRPSAIAVDGKGNVYVAAYAAKSRAVEKIVPGGATTQIGSGFSQPSAVAVDAHGNVYVADAGNDGIFKITPGGAVTQIARALSPIGVAVDARGDVFVSDRGSAAIYKL